jgi:hypothetical protein
MPLLGIAATPSGIKREWYVFMFHCKIIKYYVHYIHYVYFVRCYKCLSISLHYSKSSYKGVDLVLRFSSFKQVCGTYLQIT